MKKAVSLIFTLVMLFSFAISASAEVFNGADLFTVDLPEEFQQNGASSSDFSFENADGDTVAVTYEDNTQEENIFSPADMSEKEIEEYTKTLSEEAENVMKEQTDYFRLKYLDCEKIKHKSGKTALVSHIETTIEMNGKKGVFYQTLYEFGGVNYKYSFTFTTEDKEKSNSLNDAFDTINIFEAETESNLDKLTGYAVAGGLALLLVIGIIRFIRTPEKRAKGKLK